MTKVIFLLNIFTYFIYSASYQTGLENGKHICNWYRTTTPIIFFRILSNANTYENQRVYNVQISWITYDERDKLQNETKMNIQCFHNKRIDKSPCICRTNNINANNLLREK